MITKYIDGSKTFHTTDDFWDCECECGFIHSTLLDKCHVCGVLQEEAPESRVEEIETLLEQS